MSKRVIGLAAAFGIITLGAVVFFKISPATPRVADEKLQYFPERHVAFQSSGETDEPDDPFFVYDITVTDGNDGDQMHGTQDKVGVSAAIMNVYSSEMDDFMVIGAANAARVQYLTAIGDPPTNPQSKWLVSIDEVGIVNGQVRVKVIASAGWDENYMGRQTMTRDGAQLVELWSLDTVGSSPTLLDRTKWDFNGLQTNQESPFKVYTPPPGTTFGPFGPVPTADDMGEIGEPYGSGGDGDGDGDGPQP